MNLGAGVPVGLGAFLFATGNSLGKRAIDAAKASPPQKVDGETAAVAAATANGKVSAGIAALVVGGTAAAVGGWLWWSAPATVAVVPYGEGAVVALQMHWH